MCEKSVSQIWLDKHFCHWNDDKCRAKKLLEPCKSCPHKSVCCGGYSRTIAAYDGKITHAPLRYYATEQKYANYKGKDEYSLLMRQLVNGHISLDCHFYLENGSVISNDFIKTISNPEYRKLLKQLI